MSPEEIYAAALRELAHAKDERKSWLETAKAYRAGLTAAGEKALQFPAEAAKESGYTVNVLSRFVTVLTFVERRLAGTSPSTYLLRRSFTMLEHIERMDRLNPREADVWIMRWLDDNSTVEDIRRAYLTLRDESAASGISLKSWHTRFLHGSYKEARGALERTFAALNGTSLVVPTGSNTTPLRCHALAFPEGDSGPVDAYDFVPAVRANVEFLDRVCRAASASLFVRHYYLVLGEDVSSKDIAKAQTALDALGASTVGIISIGKAAAEVRSERIPTGLPVPDRTYMLRQMFRDGEWLPSEAWGDAPEPGEHCATP